MSWADINDLTYVVSFYVSYCINNWKVCKGRSKQQTKSLKVHFRKRLFEMNWLKKQVLKNSNLGSVWDSMKTIAWPW